MNDRGIQESGVGSNELGFARLRYIVRLEKFNFLRRTCGIFMVMVNLIRFKSVGYLLVEYPESVGAATNGKDMFSPGILALIERFAITQSFV